MRIEARTMRFLTGLVALWPALLLLVGTKAAFILLLSVLLPDLRQQGRAIVARWPAKAFWWGLPVSIAWVIAVLWCLSWEERGLPGAVGGWVALGLLLLGIVSMALGFMGVAEHLGATALQQAHCPPTSPLAATATGLLLAMAAGGVPLLGQLWGLLLCALSLGTFLLILFGPQGETG